MADVLCRDEDDYCNYNASGVVLHVGGNYSQNTNHGAFYLNGNNAASNSNANIGCRILENIYFGYGYRTPLGENKFNKADKGIN